MILVILLSSVLSLVLAGENSDDKCMTFINSRGINCVKEELIRTYTFGMGPQTDDLKECYPLHKSENQCEYSLCVAKQKGYLSTDGSVDRKTLVELLEKDFESKPQLVDNIKNKCINGDLSKYEKDGAKHCDLLKIRFCTDLQVLKSVEVWNDEGACKGMKTLMEECVKTFE